MTENSIKDGLQLCSLTIGHRDHALLSDLSFGLKPGEIFTLLSANGIGKTTLLRTILGEIPALSGEIFWQGHALSPLPTEKRHKRGLGYCPEGRRPFAAMTVQDNLDVAGPPTRKERSQKLEEIFALFPALQPHRRRQAWQLSGGQQQMLALGRALMSSPRLLLLDEPCQGLAPVIIEDLMAAIRKIAASGCAILLAEQDIMRSLTLADHICLLNRHGVQQILEGATCTAEILENLIAKTWQA